MSDLLDRLRKRIYPNFSTYAVAGNANNAAINFPQVSGTFEVGGPDKDVQGAVARIEALEANLTELLRLYDWRAALGQEEKKPDHDKDAMRRALMNYGREKAAAWVVARRLVGRE